MSRIKRSEINRHGKKIIPKYLKEDFPDQTLIPCRDIISKLSSHVVPVETFDKIVIKAFNGM